MMHFGIDLGRTGAVGMIFGSGKFANVLDLPIEVYKNTAKGKERWRLDVGRFMDIAAEMLEPDKVMIEDVWANADNGSLAGFGLGRILGGVDAVLHIQQAEPTYVAPSKWKKYLGVSRDKKKVLELARALFPEAPLKYQYHHNRAEALLIAYYSYLTTKDNP